MTTRAAERLHERDAELAALGQALDDAVAGTGRVVMIEGSAGIGKTRLLDELCRMADGRTRVLRARGGEQERDIPLLVTRELLTPLARQLDEAEQQRVFAGAADLVGPLVGRSSFTAVESDFALVHGLYWLVANLSDEQPLVLAVDDAHWVDDATQRWLAYLLPRVAELPVLLALTSRPRELSPTSPIAERLAGPEVSLVSPAALGLDAAAAVLRTHLPGAEDAFCTVAHRATGGNPLLLRSLASAVAQAGLAPTEDGARRIDRLGAVELRRIVLPRVHRLGDDAVELARAVAILGDDAALGTAAGVAGLDHYAAADAVDRLVAADVLTVHHTDDRALGFTHPLVRSVVTEELAPGQLSSLHLRAARSLDEGHADAERVAQHLAARDPVGEPWALTALAAATSAADTRGAPEATLRHLATALREPLDPDHRCGLLLQAGWQGFRVLDPRTPAWLEEAMGLARNPGTWVLAWLGRVMLLNWKDEGNRPPDLWLDSMPPDIDDEVRCAAHTALRASFGMIEVAPSTADKLPPPDTTPAGDTPFQRMYLAGESALESMTLGDRTRAVELALAAYHDGALVSDAPNASSAAWVVLTLAAAGDLARAEEVATAVHETATGRGAVSVLQWTGPVLGWIQLHRGAVSRAGATLVDLPPTPAELRMQAAAALVAGTSAAVLAQLDRLDDASAVLAEWQMEDGQHGSNVTVMGLEQRAEVVAAMGRPADALDDYLRGGEIAEAIGCRTSPMYAWRAGAARCLLQLGRRDEARELAEEQLADARTWGAAPLLGTALRTLGSVVGGREGQALLEEAITVLAGSGAEGEHARALLDLGRLLRLGNAPSAARDPLQRALDQADRNGSVHLARLIGEELRLCGARPRRRSVTGVHALTPAELRAAQLAARGLSNPEIAQSLFVTRKTVEKHLGSVFQKLQITSRDQLPAVLREDDA